MYNGDNNKVQTKTYTNYSNLVTRLDQKYPGDFIVLNRFKQNELTLVFLFYQIKILNYYV